MKSKRIICGLLAAMALGLLSAVLGGCARQPEPAAPTTSEVIRSCEVQKHGRYLYRAGGRMTRYDPATAARSPACLNPDCLRVGSAEGCPLDGAVTEPTALVDGRLYFYSFTAFTHDILLGWQDLVTGEVKVLVTLSPSEEGLSAAGVHDGYLYYQCRTLREGGSAEDPADYEPTISRVPVKGGTPEVVLKKAADEILWLVADGKLILQRESESVLYAYDLATGEKTPMYDLSANGFTLLKSKPLYTEGKLYFLAGSNQQATDPAVEYIHTLSYLVAVDVRAGGGQVVVSTPVEAFDIADGEIHYIPYRLRTFGLSAVEDEGMMFTTEDDALWACDLHGRNARRVVSIGNTSLRSFAVVGGQVHGHITQYHPEAGTRDIFWGAVDLASGAVIPQKTEGM